jgi:hypothetical protein
MKRFHYAIKAINDEILRHIGKVAVDAVDKNHNPAYATRTEKVKRLKKAIDILENHPDNKSV